LSVASERLSRPSSPDLVARDARVDRAEITRLGVYAILLFTALFYAQSITAGYLSDDHFHVLALGELPEAFERHFNLFGMVRSAEEVGILKRYGLLPWWTSDEMRINFFRPIPSITHWLDFTLFPRNAAFAHLVSIAWYLLAIYLVYRLLARFLDETSNASRVLLLAVTIFAMDDAHALNVTWIANRNETIGSVFVLLALLAWFRLREGRGRHHAVLVVFAFVGALLSKESTVALPMMILTHALIMPEREGTSLWQRVRPRIGLHAVLFAIALLYLFLYFRAGFGASSVYYVNPLRNPALWATQFFRSGFFHAVILVTGVPLHVLGSSPVHDHPFAAFGLGFVTVGFWSIAFKWLKHDRPFRLAIVWMLIGQAILTTSFPDPRNLFLPTIGFAYVVARVMEQAWIRRNSWAPARPLLVGLAGLHLVFAPVLDQVCIGVVGSFGDRYRAVTEAVKSVVDENRLGPEETQVFFLDWHMREMSAVYGLHLRNSVKTGVTDYTKWTENPSSTYAQKLDGALGAERIHYYSLSFLREGEVSIEVKNDRELVLSVKEGGNFFPTLFEQLYTTGEHYRVGQRLDNGVFVATLEAVNEKNEVTRVRFTFKERLDSPRYRFLVFDGQRFVPFRAVTLPPPQDL